MKGSIYYEVAQNIVASFNIPVSKGQLSKFFRLHPGKYSLRALIDVLYEMNVKPLFVKLPFEKFNDTLPTPILCFDKKLEYSKPILIKRISSKYVHALELVDSAFNSKTEISEFAGLISSKMFFFEYVQNKIPTKPLSYRKIGKTIILLLTLTLVFSMMTVLGSYENTIFVLSLIGLVLSALLFSVELEPEKGIAGRICMIKDFNCKKVLASSKTTYLGGFSLIDLSFLYYVFNIAAIVLGYIGHVDLLPTLFLKSLLAIPVVIYLIYYQKFRLRTFCLLCLCVDFILLAEFFSHTLLLENIYIGINHNLLIVVCISLLLSLSSVIFLLPLFRKLIIKDALQEELNFFKFNKTVFKELYFGNTQIEELANFRTYKPFIFGSKENTDMLILGLSLSCGSCNRFAKQIENFLFLYEKMKIVVFIKTHDDLDKSILRPIIDQYRKDPKLGLHQILNWFAHKRKSDVDYEHNSGNIEEIISSQNGWFESLNIEHTPIIAFNKRILPIYYRVDDLKIMLKELIQN